MQNFIILVAEDDENDVFLFKLALFKAGIAATTHFVSDGQYAIDYLAGHGKFADRAAYPLPDLAIFDIKMPRLNGLEALQWVRDQAQFQHLPIMILSSSALEADIQRATKLGANAYLVKPSNPAYLSLELKRFCGLWGPSILRRDGSSSGENAKDPPTASPFGSLPEE